MVKKPAYKVRLARIKINAAIVSINDYEFEGSSVKKISLPSRITTFGNGAFLDCSSLTSVKLLPSISTLGKDVFKNCSSLVSITLPSSITTLGDGIFHGCSSLTSVTLPPMITTLGDRFFYDCVSLSSISLQQITYLGDEVFHDCSSLTSITIPSTVTSLGYGVFMGCSSLTSITIPPEIKYLTAGLFWDCSSLTSITLPPKVTILENDVFCRCALLTTVRMEGHITAISSRVFDGCPRLTTILSPSFSTGTTFRNTPHEFLELLMDAGYTKGNPNDFLYNAVPNPNMCHMHYNRSAWARTEAWNYRLPLCTAAKNNMKWEKMKQIFDANMPAIYEVDWLSGLPMFMMAAEGPQSDLESVYNLLKQHPLGICMMKERKEGRGEWVSDGSVMIPNNEDNPIPLDDMRTRLYSWVFSMD